MNRNLVDMNYIPLVAVALLLALVGCSRAGPETYTATGAVTFDGQPVEAGEIIFRAADGSQGSWEGRITGGSYKLETTPGKKRVEITARRQIEGAPAAESGEPAISFQAYIPEKYNEKSELSAEVTADGDNRFDFGLMP